MERSTKSSYSYIGCSIKSTPILTYMEATFMKLFFAIAAIIASSTSFAGNEGPMFSAFTSDNKLHVTIMADTCNSYGASLVVPGICHADRMTANYAVDCPVDLQVVSTKMFCGGLTVPKVLTIDLKEARVTQEAKILVLSYEGHSVNVTINK